MLRLNKRYLIMLIIDGEYFLSDKYKRSNAGY